MANTIDSDANPGPPGIYQIRVKGHLGGQWSAWFEPMTIRGETNGETTVTGPVTDQSALHGLLKKVRDLGLPLLSVMRIQPDQSDS
ncbi:MAG: hypothetical protein M3457_07210 [Chloroflexota bacterium]|nr:hypothetical protein [Chloroflexota bacterium]